MYFDDINDALPVLARYVSTGPEVGSRQGTPTRERLFERITLTNPLNRYITVPGRKASLPAQIAETMWVLAGRSDIEFLSHYLPRAGEFSDDGLVWRAGYGPRIRRWGGEVDQLRHVVDLLQTDPDTRRAVIGLYDPAVDSSPGRDIACNNWLHFIARNGVLHLVVATRSNDLWWGWSGINAFEWSVLLEIVATLTDQAVGDLHFNITSLHLYQTHWDRAQAVANHGVNATGHGARFTGVSTVSHLDNALAHWFAAEEKTRAGHELSPSDYTGVPLFDEWLRVLRYWWTEDETVLGSLSSVVLDALKASPVTKEARAAREKRASRPETEVQAAGARMDAFADSQAHQDDPFITFVDNLHREKGKVYGDSWKKRGEQISILANVYRKVDRLGVGGAGDTTADTVIDLLVYLIKYRWWLHTEQDADAPFNLVSRTDENDQVRATLLARGTDSASDDQVAYAYKRVPELLNEFDPGRGARTKSQTLDSCLMMLAPVARRVWFDETAPKTLSERNETRFWKGYDA